MAQPEKSRSGNRESSLKAATRLAIGSMLIGYDNLTSRLETWQIEAAKQPARAKTTGGSTAIGEPGEGNLLDGETSGNRLRYALIGMAFGVQERLDKSFSLTNRAYRSLNEIFKPVSSPVYDSRLLAPVRQGFEKLVRRGEEEIDHWIDVGREEEKRGRAMAEVAVTDTINDSIGSLTSNEEIQELIQSQSVGLLDEVVSEIRERTVSGDDFIEGIVRTFLHRPLRPELPLPPDKVRAQAVSFRQLRGRRLAK
jgi:hypothetical protein